MDADELRARAAVVAPSLARRALAARNEGRDRDPVACLEPTDTLPHLDHIPSKIGAEYVRKREARERVAARARANVEQTAHAHRVDAHKHLTSGRLGRRGILDLQHIGRAELMDDSCFHHVSTTTGLVSRPKSAISISTTSPGRRNSPRGKPTPSGVPVAITSPGSSVRIALAAAMSAATSSIMSEVLAFCLRFPFTHRRRSSPCGSATWNAGRMPGPSGVERSAPFEASQSH